MAPPITNIVMLMLENRSYDNVLGMLYNPKWHPPYDKAPPGQKDLDGLTGEEKNRNPHGDWIHVKPAAGDPHANPPVVAGTIPTADPGEPFLDMAQQVMGLTSRPTGGNPYAEPPGEYGMMGGFVANYLLQPHDPVAEHIMMYMTPEIMPVTAFLAHHFMVADAWFGSVPTQTFANRMYSLCADSGTWTNWLSGKTYSYIDDKEYAGLESFATTVWNDNPPDPLSNGTPLDLPSVFQQLDNVLGTTVGTGTPSWKLYFHDYSITANLLAYVKTQFRDSASLNLGQYDATDYTSSTTHLANKSFTTFAEDLAAGTLAPFTVIEPRYSNDFQGAARGYSVNSNHPGLQGYPPFTDRTGSIDVCYGEQLLADIYTQLRQSSYWPGTLLIVTYDEHGGCYDHVPPVTGMAPPSQDTPPSHTGFDWTVAGPRVPTLIISPFAPRGSTLRSTDGSVFDHTSIIKTVWECFGLDGGSHGAPSLTDRDAAAASIVPALSSTAVNETGIPAMPLCP